MDRIYKSIKELKEERKIAKQKFDDFEAKPIPIVDKMHIKSIKAKIKRADDKHDEVSNKYYAIRHTIFSKYIDFFGSYRDEEAKPIIIKILKKQIKVSTISKDLRIIYAKSLASLEFEAIPEVKSLSSESDSLSKLQQELNDELEETNKATEDYEDKLRRLKWAVESIDEKIIKKQNQNTADEKADEREEEFRSVWSKINTDKFMKSILKEIQKHN